MMSPRKTLNTNSLASPKRNLDSRDKGSVGRMQRMDKVERPEKENLKKIKSETDQRIAESKSHMG